MKIQQSLWFDPTMIFIGGEWQRPGNPATIPVENPSTGEVIGAIGRGTADDVDLAVAAAEQALEGEWGRTPAFERGRILTRLSKLVLDRAEELSHLQLY